MATPPPPPPAEDDVSAPQEQEQLGASDQETNPGTSSAASKKKKKRKKKKGGGGGGGSPQAAGASTYGDHRDTFRIEQDAVAGRCVVASRNLQAGELVVEEHPFAKVVRRDHALRHCSNCCREVHEAGRIEAGVPYAVYCSRACKSEEDALRSAEASALGKLEGISVARDVDLDLLRMMLRLVVTRATALGLRPESTQEVNIGGAQEGEQHEEVGARGQVRTEILSDILGNRRADGTAAAAAAAAAAAH